MNKQLQESKRFCEVYNMYDGDKKAIANEFLLDYLQEAMEKWEWFIKRRENDFYWLDKEELEKIKLNALFEYKVYSLWK